jgi:membrane protease YdiL (CAAX protease family)
MAAIGGCIASLIVLIVRGSRGQLVARFQRPVASSPLYLESLVVFLVLFAALHVGFPFVMQSAGVIVPGAPTPSWVMTVQLLLQWSLLLTIFWPLLRGVTWTQWKAHLGWATPRGTVREIGAGLVGYGASLPVLFLVVLLLLVVMMLTKGEGDVGPPENPIAEVLMNASGINLVLLFGLMTIWAPVVEETLFRGVLYRDLRGWAPVAVAVLISGLWFGLMHGYAGLMLMPVIVIGFCFGVLREWRGSIVPTVVAHAVHNFAIGLMAIGFFTALK